MFDYNTRIKVIHIIPSLSKGGAERLVLDICTALNNSGRAIAKIIILENHIDFDLNEYNVEVIFCNSYVIPSISRRSSIEVSSLQREINQFSPHVIHTHLFKAEITAREVNYRKAVWFSHLHDNMFQFQPFRFRDWFSKKRLTEWFEKKWILRRYKACQNNFIAISRDTEKYFKAVLPHSLKRITLLHNAIRFSKFNNNILRVPEGKLIRMVSTGSLVVKKNQIFLADVVQELNKQGFTADLRILGDGICRADIENRIRQLGIADQMKLEGNVEAVENYLHNASFYVHAAAYEPFGLVLLEAMAASMVCVSLNGRGNLDIHQEGKNGFVIDPPDSKAFADTLIECARNPNKYSEIANYSYNYSKQFDIDNYINELLAIYIARMNSNSIK